MQNLAQCGGGEVVKTVLKGVSFARLEGQGGIREGRMIAGPSSVQTPATQFNEIDPPPQSTTNDRTNQPASLLLASQYDTNWAQQPLQSMDGD